MPDSPSNFISFGDWLGSNADQERQQLDSLTQTAQKGAGNAVGDAYKQGYGSFSSQGTPGAPSGYTGSGLQSYGDFVASTGDAANLSTQANAMQPGAHVSWLDALGMQTVGGDQLAATKSDYTQRLAGANSAYASGAANAAGESADAQGAYAQAQRKAGYGWNTNTTEGKAGYDAELAAGKGAQQASLAAGAQSRMADLRHQYATDPMHKFTNFAEGIEDVFDPLGFRKKFFDPAGIPSDVAASDKSRNWDPTQYQGIDYTNQDSQFSQWLAGRGIDPNTGNPKGG